jgi:hypothetical protein
MMGHLSHRLNLLQEQEDTRILGNKMIKSHYQRKAQRQSSIIYSKMKKRKIIDEKVMIMQLILLNRNIILSNTSL